MKYCLTIAAACLALSAPARSQESVARDTLAADLAKIDDNCRELLNPGEDLDLVGYVEDGVDVRSNAPTLARAVSPQVALDREAMRLERLALYHQVPVDGPPSGAERPAGTRPAPESLAPAPVAAPESESVSETPRWVVIAAAGAGAAIMALLVGRRT